MMSSGIGNFLRQYRQNNNLSRESFAEMLDISSGLSSGNRTWY